MTSKCAEEILGFEFDWLASDADGLVAVFSTGGGGFAPDEFLRDTGAHDEAIDAILGSECSTHARFAPQLPPGLKNTWRMMAERGVFAFDSDPHGGPYRLVAAPEAAIRADALPGPAAAVARLLVLSQLRFSELTEAPSDLLRKRRFRTRLM